MEPPSARVSTSAIAAQFPLPRYVPDTLTGVDSTVIVPENDTTTAPVAAGHESWVAPVGRPVNAGGVATSPEVGWLQATTCAFVSVIALAVAVAAFTVNDAVVAATAQLFAPR